MVASGLVTAVLTGAIWGPYRISFDPPPISEPVPPDGPPIANSTAEISSSPFYNTQTTVTPFADLEILVNHDTHPLDWVDLAVCSLSSKPENTLTDNASVLDTCPATYYLDENPVNTNGLSKWLIIAHLLNLGLLAASPAIHGVSAMLHSGATSTARHVHDVWSNVFSLEEIARFIDSLIRFLNLCLSTHSGQAGLILCALILISTATTLFFGWQWTYTVARAAIRAATDIRNTIIILWWYFVGLVIHRPDITVETVMDKYHIRKIENSTAALEQQTAERRLAALTSELQMRDVKAQAADRLRKECDYLLPKLLENIDVFDKARVRAVVAEHRAKYLAFEAEHEVSRTVLAKAKAERFVHEEAEALSRLEIARRDQEAVDTHRSSEIEHARSEATLAQVDAERLAHEQAATKFRLEAAQQEQEAANILRSIETERARSRADLAQVEAGRLAHEEAAARSRLEAAQQDQQAADIRRLMAVEHERSQALVSQAKAERLACEEAAAKSRFEAALLEKEAANVCRSMGATSLEFSAITTTEIVPGIEPTQPELCFASYSGGSIEQHHDGYDDSFVAQDYGDFLDLSGEDESFVSPESSSLPNPLDDPVEVQEEATALASSRDESLFKEIPENTPALAAASPQEERNHVASKSSQQRFDESFPHGFDRIFVPSNNLHCGLYAVIASLESQHPDLDFHPSLEDLLERTECVEYIVRCNEFGLANDNNFTIDQIGLMVYIFYKEYRLNVQVGGKPRDAAPFLIPTPDSDKDDCVVVWLYNDDNGQIIESNDGAFTIYSHYEGMRSRLPPAPTEGGDEQAVGKHIDGMSSIVSSSQASASPAACDVMEDLLQENSESNVTTDGGFQAPGTPPSISAPGNIDWDQELRDIGMLPLVLTQSDNTVVKAFPDVHFKEDSEVGTDANPGLGPENECPAKQPSPDAHFKEGQGILEQTLLSTEVSQPLAVVASTAEAHEPLALESESVIHRPHQESAGVYSFETKKEQAMVPEVVADNSPQTQTTQSFAWTSTFKEDISNWFQPPPDTESELAPLPKKRTSVHVPSALDNNTFPALSSDFSFGLKPTPATETKEEHVTSVEPEKHSEESDHQAPVESGTPADEQPNGVDPATTAPDTALDGRVVPAAEETMVETQLPGKKPSGAISDVAKEAVVEKSNGQDRPDLLPGDKTPGEAAIQHLDSGKKLNKADAKKRSKPLKPKVESEDPDIPFLEIAARKREIAEQCHPVGGVVSGVSRQLDKGNKCPSGHKRTEETTEWDSESESVSESKPPAKLTRSILKPKARRDFSPEKKASRVKFREPLVDEANEPAPKALSTKGEAETSKRVVVPASSFGSASSSSDVRQPRPFDNPFRGLRVEGVTWPQQVQPAVAPAVAPEAHQTQQPQGRHSQPQWTWNQAQPQQDTVAPQEPAIQDPRLAFRDPACEGVDDNSDREGSEPPALFSDLSDKEPSRVKNRSSMDLDGEPSCAEVQRSFSPELERLTEKLQLDEVSISCDVDMSDAAAAGGFGLQGFSANDFLQKSSGQALNNGHGNMQTPGMPALIFNQERMLQADCDYPPASDEMAWEASDVPNVLSPVSGGFEFRMTAQGGTPKFGSGAFSWLQESSSAGREHVSHELPAAGQVKPVGSQNWLAGTSTTTGTTGFWGRSSNAQDLAPSDMTTTENEIVQSGYSYRDTVVADPAPVVDDDSPIDDEALYQEIAASLREDTPQQTRHQPRRTFVSQYPPVHLEGVVPSIEQPNKVSGQEVARAARSRAPTPDLPDCESDQSSLDLDGDKHNPPGWTPGQVAGGVGNEGREDSIERENAELDLLMGRVSAQDNSDNDDSDSDSDSVETADTEQAEQERIAGMRLLLQQYSKYGGRSSSASPTQRSEQQDEEWDDEDRSSDSSYRHPSPGLIEADDDSSCSDSSESSQDSDDNIHTRRRRDRMARDEGPSVAASFPPTEDAEDDPWAESSAVLEAQKEQEKLDAWAKKKGLSRRD